ncbi:MAG: type IV pilus secretin PilQ [Dechloromonas sp.]|nr:type IV pilus secretin PilQ [Candidatus Dechloromonas phosphoritropha]MBP8788982.1 type IV pilus secretin PilQ [Azonexus sp.]MBP9227739.1 type IV pilus secretin PilQ [Azonexus sp.]
MNVINYAMAAIAATCLALAGPVSAQNAVPNTIEAMVAAPQGDNLAIRIDLKEPLATPPVGFSVAKPAKIAFDFPSTTNGLGKTSVTFKEGDLQSANVVEVGGRTRVVLNLTRSMTYTTRLDGKSLYVLLAPIPAVGSLPERVTQFTAETSIGKRHALQDIAFRRGKDGEARIVVDLNDAGTGIDIRQQGKSLIVDFLKTSVPENLRRKLDVTDFGTPVTSVETRPLGDNVRMTIMPHGLWEHNAYQSDNQFIVEVKRIIEDPNKLVQGTKTGYQGPRVSINYQNGDVRALLKLMAEELGLNAVISDTVTGTTTLVLKDVPADQVIDIIFKQKDLDMRKKGNIMMIAPRDEIATREKLDFEARQQISELEPIQHEQFNLNYQKAGDVAKLLAGVGGVGGTPGGASQRLLSKRGNAIADAQSNVLFVNDIPSKLEEIRVFIKAIDTGSRQVMIEARVVEAQDTFNRDLGVRLNFLSTTRSQLGGSGTYAGGGVYSPSGQVTPQTIGVNLPSFTNVGGTLAFALFNSSLTRILNLELAALEQDGLGKIVSSPRVITANNVKAKIQDGTEIPYVTTATGGGVATQNVSFKTAALSLEATPQITPEGTVRMLLVVKKEEPDWTRAVLGNPPIKTSTVETSVVVENGGTVVIGGVYVTKKENVTEKVPLLGDIPFFGYLFKYQNDTGQRRELLFFITPRIISDKLQIN